MQRRSYRKNRQYIYKHVAKMVNAGIIQPSNFDYCSGTVSVAIKVDSVACITGNTSVRLNVGQHLLGTRVYVIINMHHYFIIGNYITLTSKITVDL